MIFRPGRILITLQIVIAFFLLSFNSFSFAENFMRFVPGKRGEVTACLLAGPFSKPSELIEKADYNSIAAGNKAGDSSFKWQIYNTASGLIELNAYNIKGSFPVYVYLYCSVYSEREQNGIILFTSNSRSLLRVNGKFFKSKVNPGNNQHVSFSRYFYRKGSNEFLIRVRIENNNPACAVLLGSLAGDRAGLLKDYTVEIPGKFPSDKACSQLLLKSSVFEIRPPLANLSSECTFAMKLLPGAPVPAKPSSVLLRIKGRDGAFLTESVASNISMKKFLRGVFHKFNISRAGKAYPLVFEIMIKDGDRIFSSVNKRYYAASTLDNIQSLQQVNLTKLESAKKIEFPMSRLELIRMRDIRKSLTEEYSVKSYRQIDEYENAINRLRIFNALYSAGNDPLKNRKGLIDGAYVSSIDNSVQPFRLYIPHSLQQKDFQQGIPLVVLYHGYVPSYTRVSWRNISVGEMYALEKAGVALLQTFGRSNTDFLNVGEVDTFDALTEVRKKYNVDSRRIYLAGFSMGGSGVWTTLCHYPDFFAAAHIWSGRTDYYFWHNLERTDLPPFMRILVNTDNPVDLSENLSNIPLFVDHPKPDTLVKVGHSELIYKKLKKDSREAALVVNLPEKGTHWYFSKKVEQPDTFINLLKFKKNESPDVVDLVTYSTKYGKNNWLRINLIKDWGKKSYLRAAYKQEKNQIEIIEVKNTASFSVNISKKREVNSKAAPVIVFKDKAVADSFSEIISKDSNWHTFELQTEVKLLSAKFKKNSLLCGPVKEAFCSPFMTVVGTSGTRVENDKNISIKNTFLDEWQRFAKGSPRVKTDKELLEKDISSYNLVCIGNPSSNCYLKKLADKIPFKFSRKGYGVSDYFIEAGDVPLGFAGCYPNPDKTAQKKKLLVIFDGIFYGQYLSINHKMDFVPDFIIFRDSKWKRDTNYPELAGFFNSAWLFDRSLVYKGPKHN